MARGEVGVGPASGATFALPPRAATFRDLGGRAWPLGQARLGETLPPPPIVCFLLLTPYLCASPAIFANFLWVLIIRSRGR
jgi:hypothetical protein